MELFFVVMLSAMLIVVVVNIVISLKARQQAKDQYFQIGTQEQYNIASGVTASQKTAYVLNIILIILLSLTVVGAATAIFIATIPLILLVVPAAAIVNLMTTFSLRKRTLEVYGASTLGLEAKQIKRQFLARVILYVLAFLVVGGLTTISFTSIYL